ncbi:NUDIX hydrolase [Candidatus Saccharibacteria bacterium]|nr:NUDIX hydrolase [Candidatus Saccharibacteria bacterium]
MSERCDNRSVGVIMTDETGRILLINRAKPPYGWAPPAGHIDDHGGSLDTAIAEVSEETGLGLSGEDMRLVMEGYRIHGQCRRGGEYHDWDVWTTPLPSGEPVAKPDEVRGILVADTFALHALAQQTPYATYERPGLEPAWATLLSELGHL